MKKVFAVLGLLTILLISFGSCRNEEILENTENSKEQLKLIKSKSLWKENITFISKVKRVFDKKVDAKKFSKKHGSAYWEYALSFEKDGEPYIFVPIVKDNQVEEVMLVLKEKKKIRFYFNKDDKSKKAFFDILIKEKSAKAEYDAKKVGISNRLVCGWRAVKFTWTDEKNNTLQVDYTYNYFCVDVSLSYIDTDLGGGSGFDIDDGDLPGGGDVGNPIDTTKVKTPCEKAKIGVNNANTTLSDARIKTDFTDKMKNIAASSTNSETGMTIGKDSNGNIKVTEPITVTGTAGQVPAAPAGYNAIADGHNHNYSNPPSPGDLWTMMENLVNNPYFETRYVFGKDGSIYALTVNDRQAAIDFLAAYPRSQYLKPNSGDFIQSGALFDDFESAKDRLMNYSPFMSQIDATKNAMAYIMDKYGMGISLSKSNGTKLETVNAQQNPDGTYSTSTCN